MKKSSIYLITLVLVFLITGTAFAGYDLLTGDDSHFNNGLGDWVSDVSWEENDGNNANGSLKMTTREGKTPLAYPYQCLNIDFENWPEQDNQKTIWYSGYVKNISATSITPRLYFFSSSNCADGFDFMDGIAQTATTWTSYGYGVDMKTLEETPLSVMVIFRVIGTEVGQVALADDLKLYSSTPTAITLRNFAARSGGGLVLLTVIPLALVVCGAVVVIKKRK